MYDHSLSQASLAAQDAGGFSASVAAAKPPLQTGRPDSVAGLLDRKTYPGQRWGVLADEQDVIPGGEDAATWCAARCATTCGCRCVLCCTLGGGTCVVCVLRVFAGYSLLYVVSFQQPTRAYRQFVFQLHVWRVSCALLGLPTTATADQVLDGTSD